MDHQFIPQSGRQSNQPVNQSNPQPLNESANGQTIDQSINQSPSVLVEQSQIQYSNSAARLREQSTVTNPLSPSSPQSVNQSINSQSNQSVNRSHLRYQPSLSPPPQPQNASINQSIDRATADPQITITESASSNSLPSSMNQQPNEANRSNLSLDRSLDNLTHLMSSPTPPINNPPDHYNLPVGSTSKRVASENLEAIRMPVASPEPSPSLRPMDTPTIQPVHQAANQSATTSNSHVSTFETKYQFSTELQPLDLTAQSSMTQPTQSATPSNNQSFATSNRAVPWRKKLVLCLVGLPARGKSYIAYKLVGYLRWRGLRAQLFNVGKHRREAVSSNQDANFFDSNNASAANQRDAIAMEVLDSLLDWLSGGGDVAVFDATNTTNKRRWDVVGHCHARSPMLRVIFIESICDDASVLQSNYLSKCKNSPDYSSLPIEAALADLKKRISNYEKVYEPLADDHMSYLKLINLNSKVIANKIHGSLGHLISAYLMSIHIQPRPIYLVRTGKCEGEERIPYSQRVSDIGTRDSPFIVPFTIQMAANLTDKGRGFAKRLSVFMQQQAMEYWAQMRQGNTLDPLVSAMAAMGMMQTNSSPSDMFGSSNVTDLDEPDDSHQSINQSSNPSLDPPSFSRNQSRSVDLPLIIYTSTLPRAAQTVEHMANSAIVCEQTSALNMMDTGDCQGMTLDAIRHRYPDQLKLWDTQRYTYRFPGGESQSDKARSLESLVMELERHFFPVLVVSHASTLQVLYGYFFGPSKSVNDYYSLHIPQHHVIELRPHQYGWTERQWDLRSEEEKQEDKQMRQEMLEKLEKQGKFDLTSVMDENSQIIADYLSGNESRRGSDRFMKANIDQLVENQSKPIVGNMNGVQPETITHAAEFYEQ